MLIRQLAEQALSGDSQPLAVSKFYPGRELALKRDSWLRLKQPMPTRSLDAVLMDWTMALGKLPYLKVLKATQNYGSNHLITIRCLSKFPAANLVIALADVERIWRDQVGAGMECLHTMKNFPDRFEFEFVGLSETGMALSGVVIVEAKK